jgi:sugar O-acyltransferase (sialic acid O-acetyltransferase NeuD family)
MKDIAIYGAGGFGREIACIINAINQSEPTWNLLGYFDDGIATGTNNYYGNVIGNLEALNNYPEQLAVVMAIASSEILENVTQKISNPNIYFPNIIAPQVLFFDSESVEWGQGNVLGFGVRVSCGVKIGNFNLLNGCVSLGHDVKIGNYNVMQPDTRISGETSIGNSNFFGVRSVVLQGLTIGNHTRIGAGSVVMRNTKDGMLYFGNPAKRITNVP